MLAAAALSPELAHFVIAAMEESDEAVAVLRRGSEGLSYTGGNAAFARLTGWTPDEARGVGLARLLGLALDTSDRTRIAEAALAGQALRWEMGCATRAGKPYWLGFSLTPAEGAYYVLLGRDITERRLASQRQQAGQAMLARMFQMIDAAVAIIGGDGRVLMANPCLHAMLGRDADSLAGTPEMDHVAPESREAALAARAKQNLDGQPYHLWLRLSRADGTPLAVHLHAGLMIRQDMHRFRVLTLTPEPPPIPSPDPRHYLIAGKIRLVGLGDVRVALGARWPDLAENAMRMAERVARRRLGPNDSLSRTDDEGLLICFGGLTEEEAAFRAAMIGREIWRRLIGNDTDPLIARVTTITAAMEAPEAPLDRGLLSRMLEGRLGARRPEIEARARDTLRAAMADTRCELDMVRQRDGRPAAYYARLPQAAEHRIVGAALALPSDEMGDFDIDALRLRLAVERAQETASEGASQPLIVDVSFAVFETRGRAKRLFEACAGVPIPIREQLTFVLTERAEDVPEGKLRETLQRLRPYCREIGFSADHLEPPPMCAGNLPSIMVVGINGLLSGGALREAALFQFMPKLHARGARLLVRDVLSPEMARKLREMGVDLIAMRAEAA